MKTTDDARVIRLGGREWFSAQELADRLGVSVRTVYRRLERGEIEKRETPQGTVYRALEGEDRVSEWVTSGDVSSGSGLVEMVEEMLRKMASQSEELIRLTQMLARREGELEGAREDNRRLLEYVGRADEEYAELLEEYEATRAELMQERGRACLERGRRELAEERLREARGERREVEEALREIEGRLELLERERSRRWF